MLVHQLVQRGVVKGADLRSRKDFTLVSVQGQTGEQPGLQAERPRGARSGSRTRGGGPAAHLPGAGELLHEAGARQAEADLRRARHGTCMAPCPPNPTHTPLLSGGAHVPEPHHQPSWTTRAPRCVVNHAPPMSSADGTLCARPPSPAGCSARPRPGPHARPALPAALPRHAPGPPQPRPRPNTHTTTTTTQTHTPCGRRGAAPPPCAR